MKFRSCVLANYQCKKTDEYFIWKFFNQNSNSSRDSTENDINVESALLLFKIRIKIFWAIFSSVSCLPRYFALFSYGTAVILISILRASVKLLFVKLVCNFIVLMQFRVVFYTIATFSFIWNNPNGCLKQNYLKKTYFIYFLSFDICISLSGLLNWAENIFLYKVKPVKG